MAFTSPMTAVTGATFTAAQFNTHVRDNFNAIWVFTTAGDIIYATSSSALARLGIGAAHQFLRTNAAVNAPEWTDEIRYISYLLNTNVALTAGDDAVRFRIPVYLNGWNIISVAASRKSGTGTLTLQLRNVTDGVDVLSTKLTVDTNETDSSTAATPAVIDTSKDDVATADQFAMDVDDAGANTLYSFFEVGFRYPQ